tara:strand:- start:15 stop:230 length:216 start_codon:yes stop_codon:yes gene_type:complete
MNFTEIIFNKNTLEMYSNIKGTYENKKKNIKKYIGGLNETTFVAIFAIIIIIFITFGLGITFIIKPKILES